MTKRILISPTSFGECGLEPLQLLEKSGLEIVRNSLGRRLTPDDVIRMGSDCIGMIAGVEPLTSDVLKQLPQLKCISRCGVGMDNVDLEAAKRLGIAVINTPDAPTQSVAELTLGLMLSLLRKVTIANSNFHQRQWKKETGFLLSGKTVGILGLGRIGRKVAELLKPFGCEIIACDAHPQRPWLEQNPIQIMPLSELLEHSDILSIHVSHSPDLPPLLGKMELNLMKPGAWLLNLARGHVVDEPALYEALSSKHLAGAALDVFVQEPYTGPLCDLPNVIGTQHIASYAQEAKLAMELESVKNLLKALA